MTTFIPGDRITNHGVTGVVIDDDYTPTGMIAVVYRDDVCSGVWYVLPEQLELVERETAQ
jgi:hypothetical protein